jgi:predicted nucleic acid-binding protein
MHRIVIVNSTPIIVLLGIGRLDILKSIYGEIIIPQAVYDEIVVKDAHALASYSWIIVRTISNTAAKEAFVSALHDGEVEVMLLAKELDAGLVIIDDGLARKHAKYLGLSVAGTMGVLLRAKENGDINTLKPVLDELLEKGFYISDDIYRKVLQLADEA